MKETDKYSVKDSDYLTGHLENDLEVVKDLEVRNEYKHPENGKKFMN